MSALLSIKSELFDPLDALRDWRPLADAAASSHCNWTGVRCNWRGSVDGLDLSHMNLSGRITNEFRHLPSLAGLNIHDFGAYNTGIWASLTVILHFVVERVVGTVRGGSLIPAEMAAFVTFVWMCVQREGYLEGW